MASCDKMNGGATDIVSGGGNKKGSDNGISCCNCQKSQCLQRYCECLRAGNLCNDSCTCKACMNNENNKDKVYEKKKEIELRDPEAFQPKIIFGENEAARHRDGCNCRKSKCKNKYCACFSAGVGCSSQCKCDGCANEYGIVNNQQEHVLTNDNNNGGNNIMVDNGSSPQFQHLFPDNDDFLQYMQDFESDVDRVLNEVEQPDYYGQQMLLSSNGENGINNNNVNLPSNQQVSHVPAAVCYNYVAAPNYHQHLTPTQISRVEYNNIIEQPNTNISKLPDDLDLQGPSSSWCYGEPSSLPSFFTMDTTIQNSNQQYKPETPGYGDFFQQEAPSESGAMNQNAQHL